MLTELSRVWLSYYILRDCLDLILGLEICLQKLPWPWNWSKSLVGLILEFGLGLGLAEGRTASDLTLSLIWGCPNISTVTVHINGTKIVEKEYSKNLVIMFDNNINFVKHVSNRISSVYLKLTSLYAYTSLLHESNKYRLIEPAIFPLKDYC